MYQHYKKNVLSDIIKSIIRSKQTVTKNQNVSSCAGVLYTQ